MSTEYNKTDRQAGGQAGRQAGRQADTHNFERRILPLITVAG